MPKESHSPAAQAGSFTLGKDMTVNRMGFGAMRLTGPGIWGPSKNPKEAAQVLHRAIDLGVNFFDTADSYGPETSEAIIAETLFPYPKDLVIATKGGLTRPGPSEWVPYGRPEYLKKCVEGSLKRLRLERIDLYQLHAIDPEVPLEDSLGALKEMQVQGKIRHIGVSNVSVKDIERAQKVVDIVSVQNQYHINHRRSEDVLRICEKHKIAFIPWYPLGSGALLQQLKLAQLAHSKSITPAQLALAWLLHHSPVMIPIPGTSSVAHLEENVAAASVEFDDQEIS